MANVHRRPSWARQVLLIARKDLSIELATGEILTTSGFFAALIAIIASMAFFAGQDAAETVAPGAIWVAVAFSSVLVLSRTWQREREEGAIKGLLVMPIARSAIFAGKAVGVAIFITAIQMVVVPVTALLFSIDLIEHGPAVMLLCLAATPGIAASGTLFGAMTIRTKARDLVLASVMLPLLAPSLLTAVAGTRAVFAGSTAGELFDYVALMGVFAAIFIAGGLGLFESVIEG